jgi:hypothetical protein
VLLALCSAFAASLHAQAAGVTVAPAASVSYTVYTPPDGTPGKTTSVEPSIGADWKNHKIMYQSDLTTLQATFTDNANPALPATVAYKDVSSLLTSQTTSDPILFTDSAQGRTIVSQLTLTGSLSEFTDTAGDGANAWTPSQGGFVSGDDHQSVGGGPYAIVPVNPVYPNAIYYCSQASVTAFCSRSDTGGLTYGNSFTIYTQNQCGGLHGHVRVLPDGTAIVPNQNCGPAINPNPPAVFPNQAAVVSTDNGVTWSVNVIPDSVASLRSDPSVAGDAANKIYFGYENAINSNTGEQIGGQAMIAMSTNHGTTWTPSVDVGAPFGIQNVTFPEVIAGDAGRAAYAFLGSTTPGDPEFTTWQGTWELYVALTYDGGATWTVSDLTPGDPVQRDCIFLAGTGDCPSPSKRNLYDFMDVTVDENGRVLIGYADACSAGCDLNLGCTNAACNQGPGASVGHITQIARMTCGQGLFAKNDGVFACSLAAALPELPWVPAVLVVGAVAAGGWRIGRRRARID